MPQLQAFLNGRLVPQSEAFLPFHDAGLILGATVTDMCRTFRHRIYRLGEHLARFRRSCRYARIPQPIPDGDLAAFAEKLVANNATLLRPEEDLALVLFATPGPFGVYAGQDSGPGESTPTLGMHTFPLPFARFARFFREGIHLVVPSTRHVPPVCVDPQIKMRSRMHWWLAEQEAHLADPAAIPLLLDLDGGVTETSGANFLLVRDGQVLSPPRHSILRGISLETVGELCGELAIPFGERRLSLYDCLNADEAVLATTPYCLGPVSRINGCPIACPGPIFQRLLAAWSQRVGLDIREQFVGSV